MIFVELNTKECDLLTRLLYTRRRELLADYTKELEKAKDNKTKSRINELYTRELDYVEELYKTFYRGVK